MLELGVRAHVSGQKAIKMALSSMVSTAHANLSVGPPYDLGVYRNGSHTVEQYRIDTDSGYLDELQEAWMRAHARGRRSAPADPGRRRHLTRRGCGRVRP